MMKSSKWLLVGISAIVIGFGLTGGLGFYSEQGMQTLSTTYTSIYTSTLTNYSYSWSNAFFSGTKPPVSFLAILVAPILIGAQYAS